MCRSARTALFVLLSLLVVPAVFAAERSAGLNDHKAMVDQEWPSVSVNQAHHPVVTPLIGCGGDPSGPCQNDWGNGGGGGWSTCTTDHVCSLSYGSCWFKVYARCQNRTSGSGDPCQSC